MKLANEIQGYLIRWCNSSSNDIVLPNYYHGMYEMDVFKLSGTGYITEFEIKISRSDFKSDFKKSFKGYQKVEVFKHDIIEKGNRCNRFYFVCPENLISKEEVPEHAGLLYYNKGNIFTIKNAPLLHKLKFTDYKKLAIKLAFRDQINKSKIIQLKYKIDEQRRIQKQMGATSAEALG